MRLPFVSLIAIVPLLLVLVQPAHAGDAANGLEIAKSMCSRCHVIDKGAPFKLRPPSFQSIAIYRTRDDIWSRIIAPNPHSNMPDTQWVLTPDQIQNLLDYIISLDQPVTLQR